MERELTSSKEEVTRMARDKASMNEGMEKGQREIMESKERIKCDRTEYLFYSKL